MTTSELPLSVLWIDPEAKVPLCDVPWHGKSVVLSTGVVHFCCFGRDRRQRP